MKIKCTDCVEQKFNEKYCNDCYVNELLNEIIYLENEVVELKSEITSLEHSILELENT